MHAWPSSHRPTCTQTWLFSHAYVWNVWPAFTQHNSAHALHQPTPAHRRQPARIKRLMFAHMHQRELQARSPLAYHTIDSNKPASAFPPCKPLFAPCHAQFAPHLNAHALCLAAQCHQQSLERRTHQTHPPCPGFSSLVSINPCLAVTNSSAHSHYPSSHRAITHTPRPLTSPITGPPASNNPH